MFEDTGGASPAPNEKIEYIERMSHELGRLAMSAGFPFLAFLLDMAAEEAAFSKGDDRLKVRSRTGEAVDLQTLAARHR